MEIISNKFYSRHPIKIGTIEKIIMALIISKIKYQTTFMNLNIYYMCVYTIKRQ